jgi:peptide/nickel transport system substrate-binding protein
MLNPSTVFERLLPTLRLAIGCCLVSTLLTGCLKNDSKDSAGVTSSEGNKGTTVDGRAKAVPSDSGVEHEIPVQFGEAPALAELVRAGELPPVKSRLPANPLVITPIGEIGHYGGTLRRVLTDDTIQATGIAKTLTENLMGYQRPIADGIECNLAESFEFSADGKTAVFRLREGLRWSDGKLLTVDDFIFGYHDVLFNDEARRDPLPPSVWISRGKPIILEKVDERTLRFSSELPMGRIFQALSGMEFVYPKHAYAPFHPKYNPDANYEDFRIHMTEANRMMEPGIPRLSAWVPVERIRGQRLVYERNPYYWKIDPAGNQLPYADRMVFEIVQDPQLILLKFVNGEFDLFGRYTLFGMVETLRQKQPDGIFELRLDGPRPGPAFYLNWDAPNQVLAEAFRDKRVRMALSHAINREEVNEVVFKGLLEPGGFAFSPGGPYYSEQAYRRYMDHNPELARALLEDAGYRDQDGDGYRELKDGSRFELTMDIQVQGGHSDICELVAEHWQEIGIKTHLYITVEMNTFPRRVNGEFEVYVWQLIEGADPLNSPRLWGAIGPNAPFWHRNARTEGPPWLGEVTQLVQRALTTANPEQHHEVMARANDLLSDNVPVIVLGTVYQPWAFNRRLGNVPNSLSPHNHVMGWSRPVMHEQIYIK